MKNRNKLEYREIKMTIRDVGSSKWRIESRDGIPMGVVKIQGQQFEAFLDTGTGMGIISERVE